MFRAFARVLAVFFASFFFLQMTVVPAQAQLIDWSNTNAEDSCVRTVGLQDGENSTEVEVATIQGIGCLVRNVLAVATTFIGLAAFVMFVMGAFLYLISGGQTKHTDAAKQTITYAVIGIVVALMAFFILNLIATFTGARGILRFDIFVDGPSGSSGVTNPTTPAPTAPTNPLAACEADLVNTVCFAPNQPFCAGSSAVCLPGNTLKYLNAGQTCPTYLSASDGDICVCRNSGEPRAVGDNNPC